eukprot:GEMP01000663.1.p1 GENE.GEMP01000663.1~~GEMP01000663.1.p1  ORF type:complete len:1845 (+),score=482.73 GEMP01000663.1:24-5537(+)
MSKKRSKEASDTGGEESGFVRSKPKKSKDGEDFPRGVPELPVARKGGKRPRPVTEEKRKSSKSKSMLPKLPGGERTKKDATENQEDEPVEPEVEAFIANRYLKKVEVLKPHEIVGGLLFLGAIRDVNDDEIVVNLPYGQLGYVPKGHAMDYPDFESRKAPLDPKDQPRLHTLYKVGQLVSCCVIKAPEKKEDDKKRQRAELSIRPSLVNAGMTALHERMWISCSVAKEEEHVVLVSFANGHLGTIPKKKLTTIPDVGSIMHVCVAHVRENGPAQVTLELEAPMDTQDIVNASSVKVGSLVRCRVNKVFGARKRKHVEDLERNNSDAATASTLGRRQIKAEDGLIVSFLGALEGRIHPLHSFHTADHLDDIPYFSTKQLVVARIIAVTPDATIHLSLLPHLVDWRPMWPGIPVPVGDFLEGDVRFVESKCGAWVKADKYSVFIHISRLANKNVSKAEDVAKIGGSLRTRVLGVDYFDGWVMASSSKRILEEKLIVGASLKQGELVRGTVCHIANKAVYLQLSDFVQGVCNLNDLTDVPLSAMPEERFKIGTTVKARVTQVDCDRAKRVRVTLKKSLVKPDMPILASFEEAKRDMVCLGVVSKIGDNGVVFVNFFGDAHGRIPTSQIPEDTQFKVGQLIKVRIGGINKENRRLKLLLDLTAVPKQDRFIDGTVFESGTVTAVKDDKVLLSVEDTEVMVMKSHLADDMEQANARYQILSTRKGATIGPIVILAKTHVIEKGSDRVNIASCKPSLVLAAKNGQFITSIDGVKEGMFAMGYIKHIKDYGVFVSLGSFSMSGLALKHCLAQHFVTSPSDEYAEGQTVRVCITSVDLKQKRFGIDLRQNSGYRCSEPQMRREGELIRGFFQIQSSMMQLLGEKCYRAGELVKGTVYQLKPYGALLHLEGNSKATALALSHQMDTQPAIGDEVQCVVFDQNPEKNIIDVSLRAHLVEKKRDADVGENECLLQLIKYSYIVGTRHGQVFYLPAPENWNRLTTSSVSLQTASFAKRKIVPLQEDDAAKDTPFNERQITFLPPEKEKKTAHDKSAEKVNPRELKIGQQLKMRISSMSATEVVLHCPTNLWGHLHLIDVEESKKKAFAIDNELEVYVSSISKGSGKSNKKYHCTVTLDKDAKVLKWSDIKIDKKYNGLIVGVSDKKGITMRFARDLVGRVALMDALTTLEDVNRIKEKFTIGQTLEARVIQCNAKKRLLDVSLLPPMDSSSFAVKSKVLGEIVDVRRDLKNGICAFVRLPSMKWGQLHVTELTEGYDRKPWKKLKKQVVECFVLSIPKDDGRVDLSCRTGESRPSKETLKVGTSVQGYIVNSGPKGVFVGASWKLTGRIKLSNLSEEPIDKNDINVKFPVGKLLTATVASLDDALELTLVTKKEADTMQTLNKGDVVSGTVKRKETFGLFIRIKGHNCVGLAHENELSDTKAVTLESFNEGDKIVRAKVLKVKGTRVSLGLKDSYFEKDNDEDTDDSDGEEPSAEVKAKQDSDSESESDDDAPWASANAKKKADAGFDFGLVKDNDNEEDDKESSDEDEEAQPTKRRKKAQKKHEELELQKLEQERIDGHGEPTTPDAFERLLLTEGDSSVVWIKYMAFHLQLSELEKARSVAERAVKHINYTEDKERFNVWIAFLNLECQFGTPETLKKAFQRACAYTSEKKMHIQMTHIRERNNQTDEARKAHVLCCEKFPRSKKVWIRYLEFLYNSKQFEVAHEVLTKALLALPKRKHVQVTTKTAVLEYSHGSQERGKTIFEGLCASYPKRLDIWSVYLDSHIKAEKENLESVRDLFRRAVTMKLKAFKMKFFYKRWLDFERKFGDAMGEEEVKRKAREFVENNG